MRPPVLQLLISALLLLSSLSGNAIPTTLEEALDSLDWYVANHQVFVDKKMQQAESLKESLNRAVQPENRIDILREIGSIYRSCDIDSARKYNHQGMELARSTNDKSNLWNLQATYSSILPISGIIRESISIYESIPADSMSRQEKTHYYKEGNRLFNYVLSFYSHQDYVNIYYDKVITLTDSLLANLDPKSNDYHLYRGEQNFFLGDNSMALAELTEITNNVPISDNMYARAAIMIAYYYSINDDPDRALYYTILSAISDIASGTREYTSLQNVGEKMYEKGDVSRAYNYLTLALDDATKSGSFIRTVQTAKTMPMIYDTISRQNFKTINWLIVIIIIMAIFLAISIFLIFYFRKATVKQHTTITLGRIQIINQHKILKEAISAIASEIGKMVDYNRLVSRKLKAKAYVDLHDYATSGKVVADARAFFIERFDIVFNEAIPDFQNKLNTLLAKDKQLPVGETFSHEMRIMALVRIGITDSHEISELLGLSVNTVYTYRNKVKSRAINKDKFDDDLIKIK